MYKIEITNYSEIPVKSIYFKTVEFGITMSSFGISFSQEERN